METILPVLEKLWQLTVEVWNRGVWGVDIGTWLAAFGIFIFAFFLRGLFSRIVISRLRRLFEKSNNELDDTVLDALAEPIRFIPVVVGFFIAQEYLSLQDEIQTTTNLITQTLIAFTIFWSVYCLIDPLSFALDKIRRLFGRPVAEWLLKAMKVAVIFLGATAILEMWGIQVATILAGLGIFGVAVALGAQDLFKNLIAGILILGERRFADGDWIRVEGTVEGVVESIGFRSTRIRRFDKAPVYVPNTALSDSAVTNFTKMTNRRIYWVIGVEYKTTVDQLRQIRDQIEEYLEENEEFVGPPVAVRFVRIDKFNDSSIDIMLYCFTRTTNWGEWLEIKEKLAYRVKDIVEEAGTGFAFPSQSIYLESLPADRPEAFSPPVKDQG